MALPLASHLQNALVLFSVLLDSTLLLVLHLTLCLILQYALAVLLENGLQLAPRHAQIALLVVLVQALLTNAQVLAALVRTLWLALMYVRHVLLVLSVPPLDSLWLLAPGLSHVRLVSKLSPVQSHQTRPCRLFVSNATREPILLLAPYRA